MKVEIYDPLMCGSSGLCAKVFLPDTVFKDKKRDAKSL